MKYNHIYLLYSFIILSHHFILVYSQSINPLTSVLAVTTVPDCSNIFNSDATTKQLCGPSGSTSQVTIVEIEASPDENSNAESLLFNTFPPVGQSTTNPSPMAPCSNLQPGQNCQQIVNGLIISWTTSPAVIAYPISKIVNTNTFTMANVAVNSPFIIGDDDQDTTWGQSGILGENFRAQGMLAQCMNEQQPDIGSFIARFGGQCGLIQSPKNVFENGVYPDLCFPLDDFPDPVRNQRIGGMSYSNANQYIDDSCFCDPNKCLTISNTNNNLATAYTGACSLACPVGLGSRPNSAWAACQNLINQLGNAIKDTNGVTISPITTPLLQTGYPCSAFKDSAGSKNIQDRSRLYHMRDPENCVKESCSTPNPLSCAIDPGITVNSMSIAGSLQPLASSINSQTPIDTCVTCRTDLLVADVHPGMNGGQNKLNRLVDDWRECFIWQQHQITNSYVADATCTDNNGNFNQNGNGNVGLCQPTGTDNFVWTVADPSDPNDPKKNLNFFISDGQCQNLLGDCNPTRTFDGCTASFNKPIDFISSGSSYAPSPSIITQGLYSLPNGTTNAISAVNSIRGAAFTPEWITPSIPSPINGQYSYPGGHDYYCGAPCVTESVGSYAESITNIQNQLKLNNASDLSIQDISEVSFRKAWSGIGPMCTAYEIAPQGFILMNVTITVKSGNTSDTSITQTINLSTLNNVGSDNVGFSDLGSGVVAVLESPKTSIPIPNGGGVIVVCGVSSGQPFINGKIDPYGSPTINTWPDLVAILKAVEKVYPGITGYQEGGCITPSAPFITALQCFNIKTGCYAPYDLCKAIDDVCTNRPDLNCNVPFTIDLTSNYPSVRITSKADSTNYVDCGYSAASPSNGVVWAFYDQSYRKYFGNTCELWGMDVFNFGKDDATAQYVCQEEPGKPVVPCVPGISNSLNKAPSPCSVIGDITRFHVQTSIAAFQYSDLMMGQCLPPNYVNVANTTKQTNNIPKDICQSAINNGVQQPGIGLPLDWNAQNPQYYLDGANWILADTNLANSISIQFNLYVNGEGLNADVQTISPAKFYQNVNSPPCTIVANGDSIIPISIYNTGTLNSVYIISMDQSQAVIAGNVEYGVAKASPINQTCSVPANSIVICNYTAQISTAQATSSIAFSFQLAPEVAPNVILDTGSISCTTAGPPKTQSNGATSSIFAGGKPPPDSKCTGDNPGFWCFLVSGGSFADTFMIVVFGILAIVVIGTFIYILKALYKNAQLAKASDEINKRLVLQKESEELQSQEQVNLLRQIAKK